MRNLENVLAEIEVNGMFERNPDLYYLTVFGEPGLDSTWALRYEGHHLAFNWTFVRGLGMASSPQFFGTNPAEVRTGELTGTRVLGTEEDLGRALHPGGLGRGPGLSAGRHPRSGADDRSGEGSGS